MVFYGQDLIQNYGVDQRWQRWRQHSSSSNTGVRNYNMPEKNEINSRLSQHTHEKNGNKKRWIKSVQCGRTIGFERYNSENNLPHWIGEFFRYCCCCWWWWWFACVVIFSDQKRQWVFLELNNFLFYTQRIDDEKDATQCPTFGYT